MPAKALEVGALVKSDRGRRTLARGHESKGLPQNKRKRSIVC